MSIPRLGASTAAPGRHIYSDYMGKKLKFIIVSLLIIFTSVYVHEFIHIVDISLDERVEITSVHFFDGGCEEIKNIACVKFIDNTDNKFKAELHHELFAYGVQFLFILSLFKYSYEKIGVNKCKEQ